MDTFIFDFYNTLVDVHTDEKRESTWAPVAEYFAAHGMRRVTAAMLCAAYGRYWKLYSERAEAERRYRYPECDGVAVMESMARAAGGRLTREQAAEALCIMRRASIDRLRAFDGTAELISSLRSRGAGVYLLSNAQAAFTRGEIAECGLAGAFDGVLLSSEHGVRKPDPEFFGLLFDEYGLNKNTSVMIGDDMQNDIRGAERFGIAGLWVPGGAPSHAAEILALAGE